MSFCDFYGDFFEFNLRSCDFGIEDFRKSGL